MASGAHAGTSPVIGGRSGARGAPGRIRLRAATVMRGVASRLVPLLLSAPMLPLGSVALSVQTPDPALVARAKRVPMARLHDRLGEVPFEQWLSDLTGVSTASGAQAPDPPGAAEILERLQAYTGHWESDEKQGPEGNRFHFEYDLRWMDEARTIARIVIEQVRSDGRTVIFEGYKGRDPSGERVYYVGASPSGRGARGDVVLEGDDLVTIYDGWTADGSVAEIRDVFTPVDGGTFISRTFLRAAPEKEWRQIGEDRWTRTGPAG